MMELFSYAVPLWAVLLYYLFMAAVSNMPTPQEGERLYSWLFGTLQTLSANIERARVGMEKARNGNGKHTAT
jgi:hypothetical protein